MGLYGQTWGCLSDCSGSFDACNNSEATLNFGLVYNEYAVSDSRKLCPTGWHGSTDEDWIILEVAVLGMSVSEAGSTGGRGRSGYLLKSEELWCRTTLERGRCGLTIKTCRGYL